jgi:hypothetical protein
LQSQPGCRTTGIGTSPLALDTPPAGAFGGPANDRTDLGRLNCVSNATDVELASLDKMLKDKSDATWLDHRGGNCRHSFTGPCSTRSELSVTRFGPRTGLSTIRLADGVQSYKLEHTATSVHRSVGAECKMESLVRQTRLAQTMAQVSVPEN